MYDRTDNTRGAVYILDGWDPARHTFARAIPYLQRLRELVDLKRIRAAGLRVAADSMYGAGQGYFSELLAGGRTTISPTDMPRPM